MKPRFLLVVVGGLVLAAVSACNVFEGFASPSNDEEYIQEAHKCMREGNYVCALENFGRISNTDLKNEKICLAQITRAGLGLDELVNTISSNTGQSMLGRLATAVLPWTQEKETASSAAITECNKLSTISDQSKQSLLRTLAYFADCAVRISKTDSLVSAVDGVTTECNSTSAGNGDGDIGSADIAKVDASAALDATNLGMCEFDVRTCVNDMSAAEALSGQLGSGLGDVIGNINAVPADLKDSGETLANMRAAIITTL